MTKKISFPNNNKIILPRKGGAIVTDLNQYKISKSKIALQLVIDEVSKFIIDIFDDVCGVDSDKWSYKLEQSETYLMLYICNGESRQTVGKAYGLLWFMDLCAQKKIEFELNQTVREMIIKAESNKNPNGEIIWV